VPGEILRAQTQMRRAWLADDPLCRPTRVDRVLRHGGRVPFKSLELEVLHAPGHTEGHLLLFEPSSGSLLTGDHLMGNAVPFTATHYTGSGPEPSDPLGRRPRFRGLPAYLASLQELRARRFRALLPAHGGVLQHAQRAIQQAILFYEVRIQRVERALHRIAGQHGEATAWQVWRQVFPKADPVREMRNRMYLVIGALDLFEAQGTVTLRRRDDGSLAFRPR